ncbi:MAG: hypothetical protein FRX48_01879 [Lasallia pustulata]|uniref:Six-bladed beta-propeller, TolB-like n=1 Tax=Lasallia pustulata TaxID=136370 RepID=A0A5M8Q0C3_9LECA|nr:MAG: hypothetical protein FRX48_01879 [Lasallia pustulata]
MQLQYISVTLVAFLISAISFARPAKCAPARSPSSILSRNVARSISASVHDIYDFPKGTWVENLAVRSNGQILVTLLSSPQIYQVNPFQTPSATLVHTFPTLGCLGITELGNDIFYVATGNLSLSTFTAPPGTFSVWKVDMTSFSTSNANSAIVTKVADFPQVVAFNGMTTFNGFLLIADSGAGAVWSLNVNNGQKSKVISDPLMKPTSAVGPTGVNGIKVRDNTLYFTNTNQAIWAQVALNSDGTAAGSATVVVPNFVAGDDFQFDYIGDALFAGNNELRARAVTGGSVVTASTDALLVGSTACEFGRTGSDWSSLYVSTNGGINGYLTGTFTQPGRVVRVDANISFK